MTDSRDLLLFDETGKTVIGCKDINVKDIVLPSGITSIGDAVFYGCSALKSLIIPNSVTSIGEATFYECM